MVTHNAFFFANAPLWAELKNFMVWVALVVVYAFCLVPYVVLVKVDQISRVSDLTIYIKRY